jgi:hypothetical protein
MLSDLDRSTGPFHLQLARSSVPGQAMKEIRQYNACHRRHYVGHEYKTLSAPTRGSLWLNCLPKFYCPFPRTIKSVINLWAQVCNNNNGCVAQICVD